MRRVLGTAKQSPLDPCQTSAYHIIGLPYTEKTCILYSSRTSKEVIICKKKFFEFRNSCMIPYNASDLWSSSFQLSLWATGWLFKESKLQVL